MSNDTLHTEFAPAERASQMEVERQHHKLSGLSFVKDFLNSVPSMSLILNKERQIVYANESFLDFLGFKDFPEYLGKRHGEVINCVNTQLIGRRPGEALNCTHSDDCSGCGTTVFCRTCGAINSILDSQKNNDVAVNECQLNRLHEDTQEALDLRVWSKPITIDNESFTVFSVLDISHEKRRRALERIFFHDVMNTAGGMQGVTTLLKENGIPEDEVHELADLLDISADELIDEINAQKMLGSAESGELTPSWKSVHSTEILALVRTQYLKHPVADGKHIVLSPAAEGVDFMCDITLLRRVLGNLTKNGLEASRSGNSVTLNCYTEDSSIIFSVQNAMPMSMDVQLQVFNRSFSTKGTGRGLGTYSIKLLTERYLKGHVSFISSEDIGTIFKIKLPRHPEVS